jgi:succinate-semialdehyde dehydrogenase / glutarate-semialdehyde dehydrogenase
MQVPQKQEKIISINPANNNVIGEMLCSGEDEIIARVKQAQAAKLPWKLMGIKKRLELLQQCFHAFKKRENEIASLITQEIGKLMAESAADLSGDFDYFHDFLLQGPTYIADETTVNEGENFDRIVYEPRGVAACIVAWNYPFSNFVSSVIPNLIVGNTVIFKHSEECPLVGKLIDEVMAEIKEFPSGVFSQIYGDGKTGEFLSEQDIDLIWFIGSSAVGRKLFNIAGRKQIKAILEMGGSNPAIVFDDVAIDSIISKIYRKRFTNCGQACDAIKRLIVHKSVYPELVTKLTQFVQTIKIGNPEDPKAQLGPLVATRQLELLEAQLYDSVHQGARVITGGKRPDGFAGAYFLPTIVVDINRNMRLWRDEVFGPILPIVSFETEEEAIQLANDTSYGLGAAIYSSDIKRAQRVATHIDAGFVDINDGNHWRSCNPFGGYKISGMGCEHGRLGFQELCRFKVIAEG